MTQRSGIKRQPPSLLQWFVSIFCLALSGLFFWIFARAVSVMYLETHYEATVKRCFGGRYNQCDIVVHTGKGNISAVANLGSAHVGQLTRVAVTGNPPGWTVSDAGSVGIAYFILALTLLGGLAFLFMAVYSFRRVPKRGRVAHGRGDRCSTSRR